MWSLVVSVLLQMALFIINSFYGWIILSHYTHTHKHTHTRIYTHHIFRSLINKLCTSCSFISTYFIMLPKEMALSNITMVQSMNSANIALILIQKLIYSLYSILPNCPANVFYSNCSQFRIQSSVTWLHLAVIHFFAF